jgi:hypothetical protein
MALVKRFSVAGLQPNHFSEDWAPIAALPCRGAGDGGESGAGVSRQPIIHNSFLVRVFEYEITWNGNKLFVKVQRDAARS